MFQGVQRAWLPAENPDSGECVLCFAADHRKADSITKNTRGHIGTFFRLCFVVFVPFVVKKGLQPRPNRIEKKSTLLGSGLAKKQGSSIDMPPDTREFDHQSSFLREMRLEVLIHDMKDPISVIETGVRTLLERRDSCGSLSEKQEKILKRVLRNAQKTRQMLVTLLEIGRSQTGCLQCRRFSPVQTAFNVLIDCLESHCPSVYEQLHCCTDDSERTSILRLNGIDWQVQPDSASIELEADPIQFAEVVGNLFKNGLQYRRQRLTIHIGQEDSVWTLAVCDDGPGISVEHHEAIFERYTRGPAAAGTVRDGHGIGLAGARIMARGMGGDIRVTSGKGGGTIFRFHVPLIHSDR
uniref:histidine kinase n=1 Tax=Desulfatirhabdium butyrativorans TaxID=340467 RepID=A0A7C4MLB9_9BACT